MQFTGTPRVSLEIHRGVNPLCLAHIFERSDLFQRFWAIFESVICPKDLEQVGNMLVSLNVFAVFLKYRFSLGPWHVVELSFENHGFVELCFENFDSRCKSE